MKILVTGLCLSRNLGGPAMALTLVEQLKNRIEGVDFIFAIDPYSYEHEKKWADYYGLEIVRRDSIILYLAYTKWPFRIARLGYKLIKNGWGALTDSSTKLDVTSVHNEFMEAYKLCDAIIDMQGIAYVGDGVRGPLEGLSSYSNLYYANKHKKPFVHFIQSFGPFDDWEVRFFAKRDFDQVDFITARGKESAKYCRAIVNNPEKVYDFPDSAILLPTADINWSNEYLEKLGLKNKGYVVLSPSAVIYKMRVGVGGSIGEKHVETFALIANKLLQNQESILFLPHMYSDNKAECDREVCRKVLDRLRLLECDISRCRIVEEDLDVWQAKSLISLSKYSVVSRYHALVAAISTGVSVVTVGWNVKYYDLMEYYGLAEMAIDIRYYDPTQIRDEVFKRLCAYDSDGSLKKRMIKSQSKNAKKVHHGFDMLAAWIMKNVR